MTAGDQRATCDSTVEDNSSATIGSWIWEIKSNSLCWSEEIYKIFGLEPQTFKPTYERFLEFIHPADRLSLSKRIEESLRTCASFASSSRIIRRDGELRNVCLLGTVLVDDCGRPLRAFGSCQDLTAASQAKQNLQTAERKYREIFENAGEGIFQTTPDGQYLAANPTLARMHGFETPEELIRTRNDISRQIYVDPQRRDDFKRLLSEHGAVRGFEHELIRKDGSRMWASINARVVRDEHGAVVYYEGTVQDVTERKRAEAKSAAFATLARKLSGARAPLDAGRIIAETARVLFSWDACSLDLYNADLDLLQPMLNVDTIDGKLVDITISCSAKKPNARGKSIIENGAALFRREPPFGFDLGLTPFGNTGRASAALMFTPIQHGSKTVGLLSIQSYDPNAYDQSLLQDFVALAEHCAEAINRIQAEEAWRESEARFRQMADHLEDIFWIADKQLQKLLYINRAYERIFGRSRSDLYERISALLESIHPDDLESVRQMLKRQSNGQYEPMEYRIIRPDGAVRWISRRTFPIFNDQGEKYCVAGIAQDITEYKQSQEQLRRSEERYRELFENARDAIYVHDLNGLYTSVNRAAENLSGYTRDEIVGKHFSHFVAPNFLKSTNEKFSQKLADELQTNYEAEIISKCGKRTPVEISSRLIYENGLPIGVQGTARDITERKQTQEALRIYSRALIAAQETERQNIARELHDEIGQVLTAIKINLDTIKGSGSTSSCLPKIDDCIGIVDEAIGLVRELSLNLRPSLLDNLGLSAALRWYVDRYSQRTGIVTEVRGLSTDRRLRHEVEVACFRIVQEALTNVARHAKATQVLVEIKQTQDHLRLLVKDDGSGFDRRRFNEKSLTTLGLRGMEERTQAVGGSILIHSAPSQGTEIRAHFPIDNSSARH